MVFTKSIDPRDWNFRKKLIEELIKRLDTCLTPELKNLSSSQLTPHLEQLIIQLVKTNHTINNIIIK